MKFTPEQKARIETLIERRLARDRSRYVSEIELLQSKVAMLQTEIDGLRGARAQHEQSQQSQRVRDRLRGWFRWRTA